MKRALAIRQKKRFLADFDFEKSGNWTDRFSRFDVRGFERLFERAGEDFWKIQGERRALKLFHFAASRVPAYRDFLKKNKVRPDTVRTIADFKNVPPTDKGNYISAYPLAKRCWDGKISQEKLIAVSSGTSGEPKFWPRGGFQEFEAAVVHELLYRSHYEIEKHRTLLLIGFPMGIYVSGVATLIPSFLAASKGYDLTVMSVGNNKAELLRAVSHLKGNYDQVLIAGHPFFVKDVIETGNEERVRWPRRTRTFMCSEGFSEEWRTFVAKEAGGADPTHFLNTYGSSELLLIAYETPFSISIRRSNRFKKQFGEGMAMPSLFQYNPFLRYIESVEGELLFTAASGIPLVRFDLRDAGEVISYKEMRETVSASSPAKHWKLPFVTLRGRSDYTMIFYAANIYPEHVKSALDFRPFLSKLTGKFTMEKGYLRNKDEFLNVNIELKKGIRPAKAFMRRIEERIVAELRRLNLEYLFLCNHLDKDIRPRVKLWGYQDVKYFRPGLKPKYILK